MPKITLSDTLGLQLDGTLAPGSKLLQVLPAFLNLKNLPLDKVPFQQASAGLIFAQPLSVSAGALQLQVGANAGGTLSLIGPKQRALDETDPFNAISVNSGEIYLALGLNLSVMAAVSAAAEWVTFGLSGERGIELKCYRRFQNEAGAFPSFSQALAVTASSFVLPLNAPDLDGLPSDTVLVIAGEGVLTVSGGFTIATPVQTLASVSLPMGKALNLNASGSFDAIATLTLTGGYQIRLRRLAQRKVEIGVYTLQSQELALSVSAEAGITAQIGKSDLAQKFITALSRQPLVDVAEFQQALPGDDPAARDEQIESLQASLKQSISTKLQASVLATISALKSDEAAWLFEIDVDAAVSDEARAAITSALRGDFTLLTADPKSLPPGIVQTANILTQTNLRKQELQVNLLGVVNYVSLTKLLRVSAIEHSSTGAITLITDTSSASRLHALILIAGVDGKRLCKMLSEKFVIEAIYHASKLGVLPPEFKARHTYFEIHDQTGRQQMKDGLDVARVLGLISPDEENRRLTNADFGRTTFYAETRYTSQIARLLFLDDANRPRDVEYYETAGRSALAAVLTGDSGQEFRLRFAQLGSGDPLWNQMKQTGNTAVFAPLFGLPLDSNDPRVAAVGSDFLTITTWASAMNKAGVALREVEDLLAVGLVGADDPRLTNARAHLKSRLEDVVNDTHEHFGEPLGLLMAYVASLQAAEKSVIITGAKIETLEVSSQPELTAHA